MNRISIIRYRKTGSLDNAIQEISLNWPTWYMSHSIPCWYKYGKLGDKFFFFFLVTSVLYYWGVLNKGDICLQIGFLSFFLQVISLWFTGRLGLVAKPSAGYVTRHPRERHCTSSWWWLNTRVFIPPPPHVPATPLLFPIGFLVMAFSVPSPLLDQTLNQGFDWKIIKINADMGFCP